MNTELEEMRARKDAAYEERNRVVAALASAYPSGIARTAIEGWSEDWHGCVYIDLPTGQASWHYHDSQAHLFAHLPPYTGAWDGHTTPEKYGRLARLASQAQTGGFIGYLCRAWGESDLPVAAMVRDLEGVARFMVDQWLGEEDAQDYDGTPTLPRLKAEWEGHRWDDGLWSVEFEIGGVSVERLHCAA